MNLSPLPIQKFFDNSGRPLNGGLLFTYVAGTTTKLATYQDQAGTPNTNPVVLNFRGEANVWLDQTLTYKFVLAPEGDTDPPTRPIWSVDNISAAVTFASLTQQIIGQILYPLTPAEAAASCVIINWSEPPGYITRYGSNLIPGTTDMAAAAQSAINQAQLNGARVFIRNGKYRLASKVTADNTVWIVGEQCGGYTGFFVYTGGVWLIKDHNNVCIDVIGASAYSGIGGIQNLSIYSDKTTWSSTSGHGIQVDKVGSYVIEDIRVLNVGGDCYHIGTSGGDVTGHVYLTNTYGNAAGRYTYYINGKWCRLYHPVCDGGQWSLYGEGNDGELEVEGFHFEGFTVGAIHLDTAYDAAFTGKGFIGNTVGALKGVEILNVSGTQCIKFEKIHAVGPALAGSTAFKITGSSNFGVEISSCDITLWDLALDDAGNFTQFHNNVVFGGFGATSKAIKMNSCTSPHYYCNNISGTTSANSIEQVTGLTAGGEITDNELDKAMLATASGVAGDFGTTYVDRNRGFITSNRGITGAIPSATNVAHGLAGTPDHVLTTTYSGAYTNFNLTGVSATDITMSWAGGGNIQYAWEARLKCARQL